MEITRVLKRPMITEKVTKMPKSNKGGNKEGKKPSKKGIRERYAFEVDVKATKDEIAKAVVKMYAVEVEAVNTSINKGKPKSRYIKGHQVTGFTKIYKKAYVTVKEGQFIDFYANLPE
jgi:large subunit ribosomal protein L23